MFLYVQIFLLTFYFKNKINLTNIIYYYSIIVQLFLFSKYLSLFDIWASVLSLIVFIIKSLFFN